MNLTLNCTVQRPYSHTEYNEIMDAAKTRAVQLRHEAVQELWQFTGDAALEGLRASQRLAYRLTRRARHLASTQSTPLNIEA